MINKLFKQLISFLTPLLPYLLRGREVLFHHVTKASYKVVHYYQESPRKRILQTLQLLVVGGFVFTLLLTTSVYLGLFGKLPSKKELKQIEHAQTSKVFSADQKLIGKYYFQERSGVAYKAISPHVIQALVATEDERFYEHHGIDWRSYARVLVKSILMQRESAGGGSTLSQQLIKNLYPREDWGVLSLPISKLKEAILALRLEEVYSKEEILTLYLNTVPFGERAYGIHTASERFFSKSPKQLSVEEAAVLIGLLKATYYYNPRLFPERAQTRRNVVLKQMVKNEYLSEKTYQKLSSKPIQLRYSSNKKNQDFAPYFKEYIRQEAQKICQTIEKEDGEFYNIYTDGVNIHTTIDSRMQSYAQKASKTHMKKLQGLFDQHWKGREPWEKTPQVIQQEIYKSERYKALSAKGLSKEEIMNSFKQPLKMNVFTWQGDKELSMSPLDSIKHYLRFLDCGFVAMDAENGHVKAWVGGINFDTFHYDHVHPNAKRQVGSTFKPFLYATALENGYTPCDYFSNEKVTYEEYDSWAPSNANGQHEGYYSLKGALINSVNTVSVKLMMEVGPEQVAEQARLMGIQSTMEEVPSLALGTSSLSLFEMANAYSPLANGGYKVAPVIITYITNKEGEVIWRARKEPRERVLSRKTARYMREILQGVVDRGTAKSIRTSYRLPNDMGGKTGTTQSQADGWFMGFTPTLVTGTWVGSAYPSIHFRSTRLGQGAVMALPISARFFQQLNRDSRFYHYTRSKFPDTNFFSQRALDCEEFSMEPIERRRKTWNFFDGLFGGGQSPERLSDNEDEDVSSQSNDERTTPSSPRKNNYPTYRRRYEEPPKKKNFIERLFNRR
ncbi:penicillin-binding protein 1A [Algivirga pacifica]|uniref:Transglycosylase domain-containing protein n=1 Tax=Algivirga pacifica TaxID=1162670 RepID=A0ABP9D4N1_9BACT